jgi:hypothetical protein
MTAGLADTESSTATTDFAQRAKILGADSSAESDKQ